MFGPETIRAMSMALEDVCRALKADSDARAKQVIAVRIIDLAQDGEHDPARLRDRVLKEAGEARGL